MSGIVSLTFHSEVEALLWAMECMRNLRQFRVTFATDCSQLVKIIRNQKNGPHLQVIWRISSPCKKVSSAQRSFMYQERKI